MRRRTWQGALGAIVLAAASFLIFIWIQAPPDPSFEGKRFSTYLYEQFGKGGVKGTSFELASAAFREKGVEAAPLLAAWLESEHPPILFRLQDLLRKLKLGTSLLPSDRQAIAFEALSAVPLIGASRAVQSYLVTGKGPTIRQKAAVIFVFRFNSASAEERRQIAAESSEFIASLLSYFEAGGEDEYALTTIGLLLETKAVPNRAQFAERIRKGAERSRYLRRAAEALER